MAQDRETRTRWDETEWDEFALLLHEDNHAANYMESPDLGRICAQQLNNAAAQMMRPRHFSSLGPPRKKLLEAFTRLRGKRPGATPSAAPQAAPEGGTLARRAPPPSAPPSPLKLDAAGRPLPVPPAQRAKSAEPASPFATVVWDRNDWLAIATEIDRMYPLQKYPERTHLSGLSAEDVAFAQRVLPIERQIRHIKVASFSTLVTGLKDGFEDLKRQRREAELEQGVVAAAERHAKDALSKAAAARQAQPAQTPAPAAPAIVPAPEPVAAAPAAPVLHDAVFSSAVSSMLGMLVDRLRPVIAELIDQALNAPPPAAAAPAAPVVAEITPPVALPPVAAPKTRERRMRIGIVGNRNSYAGDLARNFPNVDFTCIDSVKTVDSIKNCERVLVLTKFISHKLDGQVRRAIADHQYIPVHGCLSEIRRVVGLLLNGDRAESSQPVMAFAA